MTVQVLQMFEPTVLTGSAATLFTAPTGVVFGRGRIRFTNPSASAVTVTAYAVPLAGSASNANVFCYQQTIAAGANLDMDLPVLNGGDFLQAFASTASVVVALSLDGVLFS